MEDISANNGRTNNGPATHLARLILETEQVPAGGSLWERLNMERVARRLIQTARVAAAEHAMVRVQEAIRQLNEARGTDGGAKSADSQPPAIDGPKSRKSA